MAKHHSLPIYTPRLHSARRRICIKGTKMTTQQQLDQIHQQLTNGEILTLSPEQYELIATHFQNQIPYGTLKGRDTTLEEWFIDHWTPNKG